MFLTTFYTTASMERMLGDRYEALLLNTQHQDQNSLKYNAKAFVHVPDREFLVKPNGEVYLLFDEKCLQCPLEQSQVECGRIYRLDIDLLDSIRSFQHKNKDREYKVTFHITGKYGPTIEYVASRNVYPATLYNENQNERVEIEDDDKYDICC